MIFDEPTASPVPPQPPGLISRLLEETSLAKSIRQRLGNDNRPTALFLGTDEWAELRTICETFDVNWRGVEGYDPVKNEDNRAEFNGFKIYRVDAKSFLAAL